MYRTGFSCLLFALLPLAFAATAQEKPISFSNRWAILVGAGNYAPSSRLKPLNYAAQDVALVKETLIRLGGFGAENITALVDSQATRAALDTAFARLKGRTGPQDLVLFYFSGRGTRIADDFLPDLEPDKLDECLLLYDATKDSGGNYLRDDDIGLHLRRLDVGQCVIIIDACYNGNGEDEKGLTSSREKDVEAGVFDGITQRDYLPVGTTVLEASGPQETTLDGLFTKLLRQSLEDSDRMLTLDAAYHRVKVAIESQRPGQHVRFLDSSQRAGRIPLIAAFAQISSEPSAATVVLNGDSIDVPTPVQVVLDLGANNLRVVKGSALWDTSLAPVKIGSLAPIQARLQDPLPVTPRSRLWLWGLLAGGGILLAVAFLSYKIIVRRQTRVDIARQRGYAHWASSIDQGLLASGEVYLSFVPQRHRDYAGQTYASEHDEFELEVSEDNIAFGKVAGDALADMDTRWQAAAVLLDELENSAFEPAATAVIELLCRMLGFTPQAQSRRIGCLWGVVVQAPTRSKLPSTFPFIALQRRRFSVDDVESLRTLMGGFGIASRFAILIVFDQAAEARALIKNTAQGLGYDFIVLNEQEAKTIVVTREAQRQRIFMRPILQQIDLSLVSPYVTTGPAPENIFFGREVEIKTILQTLRSKSIGIVGGRRIGKTSILHQINRTLKEPSSDYLLFYANYQPVTNYEDFFAHGRSNWKLDIQGAEPLRFYEAISALKDKTEKPIVFLMDEVDALLRYDVQRGELLFKTFRALSEESKCRFIFSGERILHAQLHNLASPLLNFCDVLPLRYLDAGNAERIIIEPMALMDIELEDRQALVRQVLDISSCHPRIIQYLCDRMVRSTSQEESRRITLDNYHSIETSGEFHTEFIETIWGQGDPLERIITLVMAADPDKEGFSRDELHRGMERFDLTISAAELDTALNNLHLCAVIATDREPYSFTAKAFPRIVGQIKDIPQAIEQLMGEMHKTPLKG